MSTQPDPSQQDTCVCVCLCAHDSWTECACKSFGSVVHGLVCIWFIATEQQSISYAKDRSACTFGVVCLLFCFLYLEVLINTNNRNGIPNDPHSLFCQVASELSDYREVLHRRCRTRQPNQMVFLRHHASAFVLEKLTNTTFWEQFTRPICFFFLSRFRLRCAHKTHISNTD